MAPGERCHPSKSRPPMRLAAAPCAARWMVSGALILNLLILAGNLYRPSPVWAGGTGPGPGQTSAMPAPTPTPAPHD